MTSASSAGVVASAVSGLDVDSYDGCSCSAAGSSVGVSNSVFRVVLSVSGLRTFAITASSRIPSPARFVPRRPWPQRNGRSRGAVHRSLLELHVQGSFLRGTRLPAAHRRPRSRLVTFGKHPAGNCRLEGGRSSLLESAQEATLSSVPTFHPPVNESRDRESREQGTEGPRDRESEVQDTMCNQPNLRSFEGWSPSSCSLVPLVPWSLLLLY